MEHILRGMLGITVLIGILYLFSANRKYIDWKLVMAALASQLILGILVIKVDFVQSFFSVLSGFFITVIDCTQAGTEQVFGKWPQLVGIDSIEFTADGPQRKEAFVGYVFAIQVLPTIIFFSALSAILYYLGILQKIIYGLAWFLGKIMRLTGAESMAAAANVFIGQTEAPLIIKPFLSKMSKSEIMCLMVGGMATIAGGVLAAYIGFLGGNSEAERDKFAMHLLTASIMSAPAAILAAKMLYPETKKELNRQIEIPKEQIGDNLLDAISKGTNDGLRLAVNVGAMLIVFTALMYMVNMALMSGTDVVDNISGNRTLAELISVSPEGIVSVSEIDYGINSLIEQSSDGMFKGFTLEYILGIVLAPLAWILGTPWEDCMAVGQLLGQKTILNEFVAYSNVPKVSGDVGEKSKIIITYALCGFANFASIGIQIGGIGSIAPERRKTLSEFGIKALIGGTIACFLTATIAGTLVSL